MYHDNERALELIESATRTQPFCWCGSHTDIAMRDGALRLACATLTAAKGRIRRILDLGSLAHVDRPLIDLEEWAIPA